MSEGFFDEMKRYVRFGAADEQALRELAPGLQPELGSVVEEFYARITEHPEALAVFRDAAQIERLKVTLLAWMELLLKGPWDHAYFVRRCRIGQVHVRIGLPQRYMFGGINLIRAAMTVRAERLQADDPGRRTRSLAALQKIFDIELAIMLETYHQSDIERLQQAERGQRQQLEARLAMTEARYAEIVETAESLIATFDGSGHLLFCNRRCAEALGTTAELLEGQSWFDRFVSAEQRATARELCGRVLRGEGLARQVGTFSGSDGLRRVRWHLTTLPDAASRVLCAIGVDVTDEEALALQTRRAERLASLGTMAAGLAHELRNPLNSAHLQLTLMQRRMARPEAPDLEGARHAAGAVADEMKRLSALVDEFLLFSRPQPLSLRRHDLRAIARDTLDQLQHEAAEGDTTLELQPGPEVAAELDEHRVRQALANLVRNAIDAVASSGRPGKVLVTVTGDGDSAHLEITDDGPGIARDLPVFEPFFSTRPHGTGLGLAIAHRVVEDHGGQIGFRSQPGQTVFKVALPRGQTLASTTAPARQTSR